MLALLGACAMASDATAPGLNGREQIDRLTVHRECQHDTECRSIGIGLQACGGPQAYLPWSTRSTDAKALQLAVLRYSEQRRKQIEREGEASTCAMLADPGARCERSAGAASGRCVLLAGPGDALR